jgi:hypothetical protein
MKLFNIKNLLIILVICCSISIYFSQTCKDDMGCSHKDKFVSWAPPVDINGKTQQNFKDLNFHKVYVLHNGLSIVDSGNPNKGLMEQDPENPNYGLNASVMVRKIYWGQIRLECGKYKNKLCMAGDYPDQSKINEAKTQLEAKGYLRILSHCIVIPFFDDIYYEKEEEKLTLFCLPNTAKDIFDILKYKEYLSRKIENKQIVEVGINETQFNSINNPIRKFITFDKENRRVGVNLQVKFNYLVLWHEKFTFIKKYSLLEQEEDGFALRVDHALEKHGSIPAVKDWSNGLPEKPSPSCCLFLKGKFNDVLACVANEEDQNELEMVQQSRCVQVINEVQLEIHDFVYKAKLENAFDEIANTIGTTTCEDAPWNVMINRYKAEAETAIKNCEKMFLYAENTSNITKTSKCMASYDKLMEEEKKFLTKGDAADFVKKFEECVVNKDGLKEKLDDKVKSAIASFIIPKSSFFFKQKEVIENDNFYNRVFNIQEK